MRKIMRGSATKSYGIEVANLAGIPLNIINRAKEIVSLYERRESIRLLEVDRHIE